MAAQARLAARAPLVRERGRRDSQIRAEHASLSAVRQFAATLLVWVVQRDDPDVHIVLAERGYGYRSGLPSARMTHQ